jgi:hypothetical protein
LIMSGLPAIANNLAMRGRNGDSVLMHVTPGEIQGLQALAQANGTSLTTNPDTGLPEAFKLKSLLPMLAGFALAPFTAGTSLAFLGTPMGAGLTVGGIEALRTKDLGRGLLAGLGAYGGAGMGSALAASGSQAAATSALPVGGATATGVPANAATGNLLSQSLSAPQASLVPGATGSSFLQAAGSTLPANVMPPAAVSALETAAADQFAKQGFASQMGQGAQAAVNDPRMFMSNLGAQFPSNTGKAAATIGLTNPFIPEPKPVEFPEPDDPYAKYKGPYKPTQRNVSYPSMVSSREHMYFDPSNPYPFSDGGAVEDRAIKMPGADYNVNQGEWDYNFRPIEVAKAAAAPSSIGGKGAIGRWFGMGTNEVIGYTADGSPIYSRNPTEASGGSLASLFTGASSSKDGKYTSMEGYKYDPATQQMVKMSTGGSVPTLEDGGFVLTKKAVDGLGGGSNKQGQQVASMGLGALPIKGKGHGTSDSIKTTIDGKVPARVSNGEAYIPRKNVQQAGGAQKFYALMKRAERQA